MPQLVTALFMNEGDLRVAQNRSVDQLPRSRIWNLHPESSRIVANDLPGNRLGEIERLFTCRYKT